MHCLDLALALAHVASVQLSFRRPFRQKKGTTVLSFVLVFIAINLQLFWTSPGMSYVDDGNIYWAYLDASSPVAFSITSTIGQVSKLLRKQLSL